MPVELLNAQRQVRIDVKSLKGDVQSLLSTVGYPEHLLSLLLTDDRRMGEIHERWMGDPRPTDVLAFPQLSAGRETRDRGQGRKSEPRPMPHAPCPLLGDIVISVETAKRRRPRAVQAEIRRTLVHGVLHLVGLDHATKRDRLQMQRESRRLLKILE